jgi:hypothetical protein
MVVLVVVVVAAVAWGRDLGDRSDQVAWCGRTYLAHGVVTGAEMRASEAGVGQGLRHVGRVPSVFGQDLYASPVSADVRHRTGQPCAMVVYLHVGPDRYREYGISGGP